MSELAFSINAWSTSAESLDRVFAELTAEQWNLPTDLPGWSVRDILAHLAHIEAEAKAPEKSSAAQAVSSDFTEAGVAARCDRAVDEVLREFQEAVDQRRKELAVIPDDPEALADRTPGGIAWDWRTTLRNRAFDMWMHEQDIRRAVGIAGGMFHPGGQLSRDVLASTMGYVLGRKVQAEPGSAVRFLVWGPLPLDLTIAVDDSGRARPVTQIADLNPTTLRMNSETFVMLAGGRREPDQVDVDISGDSALADAVLANMALRV